MSKHEKNQTNHAIFLFLSLLLGCRKELEDINPHHNIDRARLLYEHSLARAGDNVLFDRLGLSVDWDTYREVNDSTFVVSTRLPKKEENTAEILGTFELYFNLKDRRDETGIIRYILPSKEQGRADYIAYSFQGRVIMPKRSLNPDRLAFKGSSDYYKPVI